MYDNGGGRGGERGGEREGGGERKGGRGRERGREKTFILQKVLLVETGLSYICQTYERFSHVAMILVRMTTGEGGREREGERERGREGEGCSFYGRSSWMRQGCRTSVRHTNASPM